MCFAAPFRVRLITAVLALALFAPGRAGAQAAAAPSARFDDSTANGIIIGAAVGTIAGVLAANVVDDRCGGNLCNNPSLQTYLLGAGVGAGAGIGIGWLIDKLHQGKGPAPVAIAIRADHEARAVRVQWRF
jgi:Na+/H+ antiporter NhaA